MTLGNAEFSLADLDTVAKVFNVALVLDESGSMENEFKAGYVANILNNIGDIASKVDDDGIVNVVTFNKTARKPAEEFKAGDDAAAYLAKNYKPSGGTAFAPALQLTYSSLDKAVPNVVFFLTDGESDKGDEAETEKLLSENDKSDTYILFVRVGTDAANNKFIETVADKYDQVGYANVPDASVDAAGFFAQVLTNELGAFLQRVSKAKGN